MTRGPGNSLLSNSLLASFAAHRDSLLRFLKRRVGGDAALAEDLAQETWLRAAGASGAGTIDNPRAYLFRIAANLALDHHRHARRGIEVDIAAEAAAAVADPMPSPETVILHRSELARFLRAVDTLTPRCREAFILVKVHGLSYAEAAAKLGISRNTVMVHMTHALAHLDAHFDPRGESGG